MQSENNRTELHCGSILSKGPLFTLATRLDADTVYSEYAQAGRILCHGT